MFHLSLMSSYVHVHIQNPGSFSRFLPFHHTPKKERTTWGRKRTCVRPVLIFLTRAPDLAAIALSPAVQREARTLWRVQTVESKSSETGLYECAPWRFTAAIEPGRRRAEECSGTPVAEGTECEVPRKLKR